MHHDATKAMIAKSAKGVMTKPGAVDVGRAAKNAERVQMIVRRVEMPQRSETTIEEKALMDVERVRTGKRKTRKIRSYQGPPADYRRPWA